MYRIVLTATCNVYRKYIDVSEVTETAKAILFSADLTTGRPNFVALTCQYKRSYRTSFTYADAEGSILTFERNRRVD